MGFVPSTPLLVPDLAGPMLEEANAFRAAARDVVDAVLSGDPQRVVVVGACEAQDINGANAFWDFSGFGLPSARPADSLPLPWQLGLGAWLLGNRGWSGACSFVGALSATVTDAFDGRTAYLAVGDGSVFFPSQPPDGDEATREQFDTELARAVATGDVALLARVAATPGQAIGANGPPVWRVVADAVGDAEIVRSSLVYDESPFGVRYVAGWWLM